MDIRKVEQIQTKEDLSKWILDLREDLLKNPVRWENSSLESFLEALSAWIEDSDGYYQNNKKPIPENPSWKNFAEALMAATIYE